MGNPDGGDFNENDTVMSTDADHLQSKYDQEQEEMHLKKYNTPAYREIRTRKNGLKANTMSNGFKVIKR